MNHPILNHTELLELLKKPKSSSIQKISQTEPWHISQDGISHKDGKFFEVNFYQVSKGPAQWVQPLMKTATNPNGVIALFVCSQTIQDTDEVLVLLQIRDEPGFDTLMLGPSLQASMDNPLYQKLIPLLENFSPNICNVDGDRYDHKVNLHYSPVITPEEFSRLYSEIPGNVVITPLNELAHIPREYIGDHLRVALSDFFLDTLSRD